MELSTEAKRRLEHLVGLFEREGARREALALYRRLGDTRGIAASLLLLGSADADDQGFEAARDRWEEAERLFQEAGDPFNAQFARRMLAWAYDELGDLERARSIRVEVLCQARAAGYKHLEMHALEAMAHKSAQEGEIGQATEMLAEAYKLNCELGDRYREAVIVCRFARLLAYAGEAEAATRVLAAGETLYEEFGGRPIGWVRRGNDEALDLIRAKLDEAAFAKACEQGRSLTADEAVSLALETLRQGRGHIT